MGFAAIDHDAVFPSLHYPQVKIRVHLLAGRKAPITLDIGHGAIYHQIFCLHIFQIFNKVFLVIGSVSLVDLVGGGIYCIEGILANAALEAAGHFLAQHPLPLDFLDQILIRTENMVEKIDFFPCQGGSDSHQILMKRVQGQVVGHGHRIHGRDDNRMVHRGFHLLTEHVQIQV